MRKDKVPYILGPTYSDMPKKVRTHKACPGCGVIHPIEHYTSRTGRKTIRCTACRKIDSKKNSARAKQKRLNTKKIKSELLESMYQTACSRCGYNEFRCALEFHHYDRRTKDSRVSTLISRYAQTPTEDNWDKLVAEAGKCSVLCSNCHQAFHAKEW